MLVKLTLLAGLLATTAIAKRPGRCGTPQPDIENLALGAAMAKEASLMPRLEPAPIVIPTYFHVVAYNNSREGGYLADDAALIKQLEVLNADYGKHNITFDLKGISRAVDEKWSTNADIPSVQAMRRSLRRGGYNTLNVYFQHQAAGNLGYCSFPREEDVEHGTDGHLYDGCAVLTETLPGGTEAPYNLGRTATHEIGHWLLLYHTFEGGCTDVGDEVDDTPAQSEETWGCPATNTKDSCPDQPGFDPVNNYMDYTDDFCMNEFTDGQARRMRAAWHKLRANRSLP